MRRQLLVISLATILFTPHAFAGTMSADAIKGIHQDLVTELSTECKKEKLGSDDVCDCYGKTSGEHLDEAALAKCPDGPTGEGCVSKVANEVMKSGKAFFEACKNGGGASAASAPSAPSAASTPSTTSAPSEASAPSAASTPSTTSAPSETAAPSANTDKSQSDSDN